MPYVATVVISGICYLANGPNNTKQVVMPNAMEGVVTNISTIPPHYTFVKFIKNQAVSGNYRKADFSYTEKNLPGVEWGVILLHGETVSFDGNTTGVEVNTTVDAAVGGKTCADAACTVLPVPDQAIYDDRQPYSMVVKQADACPRCRKGPLPGDYLDPRDDKVVSLRLDVTDGFLAAGAYKGYKTCKWTFRPQQSDDDPEPAGQLLPQMVSVDMLRPDDTLTLSFKTFDGSSVLPLKLDGKNTDRVLVIVGNAPLSDILGVGGHADEDTDEHFQLYYKLISSSLNGHPIPQKLKNECRIFIRTGNCPPMQQ
jgi:hypothetical protein